MRTNLPKLLSTLRKFGVTEYNGFGHTVKFGPLPPLEATRGEKDEDKKAPEPENVLDVARALNLIPKEGGK